MTHSPQDQAKRVARSQLARKRLLPAALASCALAGVLLIGGVAAMIVCKESGADRATLQLVAIPVYAGMALLFVALGLGLLAVIRSRCPLCGARLHPAYVPSERIHCPYCGRKLPAAGPGQSSTPPPSGN